MDEYYKDGFSKQKIDFDKKTGIASATKEQMDKAIEFFIINILGQKVLNNDFISKEQR